MAISNTYTFSLNRDEIIEAAYRKLNALLEGNTANSAKLTNGSQALNVMLKSWSARSYPIHNVRRLFVLPNTPSTISRNQNLLWDINIGVSSSSNHCTSTYVRTTTTATAAAAATSILVSSISGISAGNSIGIELTSTSSLIHWTTVSGAPSGSTVNLASAIPSGQSVPSGANVYVYASADRSPRPIGIVGQWNVNLENSTRFPINLRPEDEIYNTPYNVSGSSGTPVNISYRPNYYGQPNSTDGVLTIYPGWGDAANIIELRAVYPFSDLSGQADEVQAPPEWFEAIIYGLADRLAPEYGLDAKLRLVLKKEAEEKFDWAMLGSNENSSLYLMPDYQGR